MSKLNKIKEIFVHDPRHYQMCAQLTFLVLGIFFLEFNIDLLEVIIALISTFTSQLFFSKLYKIPFSAKSAIITGLSLSLLLRTNHLWVYMLAGFLSIASKFIVKIKNKHIFNPAAFGIVITLMITKSCWLSPGQWGSLAWLALIFICLGMIVTNRSSRADVSLSFITMYISLLILRGLWLNEPFSLTLHQIQNGAVLLFAFFTISDPKTTPNSKTGRIVFGFLIACLTLILKFNLYISYDLLYTLFILSPLVPLIDYIFPGKRFNWEETLLQKVKNEKKAA
jgi:Na+-transporting NADH:ubiquinone oxidoreductase subunit NqrB